MHLLNQEISAFPEGGIRSQTAYEAQEETGGGFLKLDRGGHEIKTVAAPVNGVDPFPVFLAVTKGDTIRADAGGRVLASACGSGFRGSFCLFAAAALTKEAALETHGQQAACPSSQGEGHAVGGVIVFDTLVIAAGQKDGTPALDACFVAVEEGVTVVSGHGGLYTDIDHMALDIVGKTVPLTLQIHSEGTGQFCPGSGGQTDTGHFPGILVQVFIRFDEIAQLGLEGAGDTGGSGPQERIQVIGVEFS